MTNGDDYPLLVVQPSVDYATRLRLRFPDAVLLATPDRADRLGGMPQVIPAPLDDPEAALRIVGNRRYGGIVCYVCDYLPLTAFLAARLGLPFHSEDAIRRTRDKSRTAAVWQAAGVPTPATRLIRSEADLEAFAGTCPGPWILKPVDGTGSEWVLRVDHRRRLSHFYRLLCQGLAEERCVAPDKVTCLAQQFVQGREFGADLYLRPDGGMDVLRLTEKCLQPAAYSAGIVDAYYVACVDESTRRLIQETCHRGMLALGLGPGIVMADLIMTQEGPCLLEMAGRPGGDCLPDLCLYALGYDPICAAARVALGHPPEYGPRDTRALAALHLMSERNGTVRAVDYRRLLAHPRVVRLIEVYHGPGEELRVRSGAYDDRIVASCLVECDDPEELPALCDTLSSLIDLELDTLIPVTSEAAPA